ncbi:MAG: hypothetical protein P8179_16455, partial [Candidatus Thiodiazotropha sp.]
TEIDAGTIPFVSGDTNSMCLLLFDPSWNYDGTEINYLFQEPDSGFGYIEPTNNLWQISRSPEMGTTGERLLNWSN